MLDEPLPVVVGSYPSALDELTGLFEEQEQAPRATVETPPAALSVSPQMEVVGFDDPLPAAETLPRGIPIADMTSVSFESLFEENPNANGSSSAQRPASYQAF